MPSLRDGLQTVLTEPTPAALAVLHGALLVEGRPGPALDRMLDLSGRFHAYLCELEVKISARDYSELASRLDMGAVGLVALENLVATPPGQLWERLLLGGLGEVLMVAASRQYVKAWQAETTLVHRSAAWHLAEALWWASAGQQTEVAPVERWQAIESLLAPAHDPAVPAPQKALLLGRIFQVLLVLSAASLALAEPVR